jgi:hypothetical protein
MKHEIIYTQSNAFILTDVFENQTHCWHLKKQEILEVKGVGESSGEIHHEKGWNKPEEVLFIAAHRPLNDIPVLEGVPLLPEFSEEEDVEDLALAYASSKGNINPGGYSDKQVGLLHGFIDGYNKAKETYKYTEEDLIKAFKAGHSGAFVKEHIVPHYNEYIQSLQQPKRPKYFECEMEKVWVRNTDRNAPTLDDFDTIVKTITNSQGQTELVGEFIY